MNTNSNDQQAFEEVPVEVQDTILMQARKLPSGPARSEFVRNVTRRTGRLLCNYRCTLSYGMIGMILGELIDETLSVTMPEHLLVPRGLRGKLMQPTFGLMDKVLGVLGGWMGLKSDRQRIGHIACSRQALHDHAPEFRKIIREELALFRAALQTHSLQSE